MTHELLFFYSTQGEYNYDLFFYFTQGGYSIACILFLIFCLVTY